MKLIHFKLWQNSNCVQSSRPSKFKLCPFGSVKKMQTCNSVTFYFMQKKKKLIQPLKTNQCSSYKWLLVAWINIRNQNPICNRRFPCFSPKGVKQCCDITCHSYTDYWQSNSSELCGITALIDVDYLTFDIWKKITKLWKCD